MTWLRTESLGEQSKDSHFQALQLSVLFTVFCSYIKELEERVHSLESDLQAARSAAAISQSHSASYTNAVSPDLSPPNPQTHRDNSLLPEPTWITLTSNTTIFNLLHSRPPAFQQNPCALPNLPSAETAEQLIQTVYMHTQARYCIVDWARVHRLNEMRALVCNVPIDKNIESQSGVCFRQYVIAFI